MSNTLIICIGLAAGLAIGILISIIFIKHSLTKRNEKLLKEANEEAELIK